MASDTPYFIPQNNWTKTVVSLLGNGASKTANNVVEISKDGLSGNNPVLKCEKPDFNSTYTCGTDTTTKTISLSDAWSKSPNYDCSEDFKQCSSLKLTLDDTGVLTVTDAEGNALWTSTAPGIDSNNPPLALDAYANASQNPASGRHSPDNFLKAGDFLQLGEWIGSPSGKYRLEMVKIGNQNTLQVTYNVLGCSAEAPLDPNSAQLYSIPSIFKENLGKVGRVNEHGQLQPFPSDMTNYSSNSFQMVGNYGFSGGDLSAASQVSDAAICQTNCANLPDQCIGFVYDKVGRTCQMKGPDNSILQSGHRFINDNYEYYVRTLDVSPDVSCSATVETKDADAWNAYPMGEAMTKESKCGMALATAAETAAAEAAYEPVNRSAGGMSIEGFEGATDGGASGGGASGGGASGGGASGGGGTDTRSTSDDTTTNMSKLIDGLFVKYTNFKNRIFNTDTALDVSFNLLQKSRQQISNWSGDTLNQLKAMNEDRELNTMSQTYKYIMWSILAIVVVIGIMTYMNSAFSTASSGPSSAGPTAAAADASLGPSSAGPTTASSLGPAGGRRLRLRLHK